MQLRITAGPDAGKTIEPSGESFTIGREDVDFLLADDEVSRRHLEIRTLPDGRVEVADLGSRNGTRVNGERISEPRALAGGEEITVGTTTIVVEGPPPVAETVVGREIPTGDETVVAGNEPTEAIDPDATIAEPTPAPPPPAPEEPPPVTALLGITSVDEYPEAARAAMPAAVAIQALAEILTLFHGSNQGVIASEQSAKFTTRGCYNRLGDRYCERFLGDA